MLSVLELFDGSMPDGLLLNEDVLLDRVKETKTVDLDADGGQRCVWGVVPSRSLRTHPKLAVLVHGERIPYPTFWRRGLPHRFGIFLEWHDKNGVWQHKLEASQSILPPEPHLSDVINNADI
jgi:hypothetical protein